MNTPETWVSFHGGARSVTGSNFLLESAGKNILIDCGLFQGGKFCDERNREPFPYDPAKIDIVFVTHAHIDHVGRIPKLVRDGFRGRIYSTPPTKDIAELILADSLGVLAKEAAQEGKKPFYEEEDVRRSMELWETVPYRTDMRIGDGLSTRFLDAGHILGSAMVAFTIGGKKLVFTGDLGNSPAPLLHDTESIAGTHVLVTESVYGDRDHEEHKKRKHILEDVIEDAVRRGGALLIPAFSIERTQELLFELNDLVENKRIPEVPVYLDSPLAIKVTEVYKRYAAYFNDATRTIIKSRDDIFKFPNLTMTLRPEESKAIFEAPNPKVILAGSGMSNGGRIVHHEKKYLPDPQSTLLIVGYQAVGTPGRALLEGAKSVMLYGDEVPVRARIEHILGYSAHKDSTRILEFVEQGMDTLERVHVAIGEPKSALFLAQRIRDYLGIPSEVPDDGTRIKIF